MSESIINQLDDITANQIAAGEVVERPASVIKELVENSIDAKATKIKIEIEEGGVKLMRVCDNGIGMCKEDAIICLQRHATSKISSSRDLGEIKTLGFRGEALPSISSVSFMKLSTCDNDNNEGYALSIKGGVIENMEDFAQSQGTSIEVCDLFYNTPARLKFLKSKATENSHIIRLISEYAICYPNIRFELIKDKKQTLISSPNGNRMNAVASVLGLDIAKTLIPFSIEENECKVYGYVSKSDYVKNSRKEEYLFVNGRSVKNRNILFAAELPYKNLLGPGKYPVVVAFVELDEKLVDVNVHPTKSEVKFANEKLVHSLLYKAVYATLLGGGGMHSLSLSEKTEEKKEDPPQKNIDYYIQNESNPKPQERNDFKNNDIRNNDIRKNDYVPPENIDTLIEKIENVPNEKQDDFVNVKEEKEDVFDPFDWDDNNFELSDDINRKKIDVDLSEIKIISQYKNTYIICECVGGIIFIDQHVAHERILYNKMIQSDYSHNYINPLLIPQTVNMSGVEADIVCEKIEELKQIGYDIELFGNNSFIIRGVPSDVNEKYSISVFKEIVSELSDLYNTKKITLRPEHILISASCKKAIKAGRVLTMEEMKYLVNELVKTNNPFTCPHNRPIIVSVSDYELYKKFKRI